MVLTFMVVRMCGTGQKRQGIVLERAGRVEKWPGHYFLYVSEDSLLVSPS